MPDPLRSPERNQALDALRLVAAFCVVALHVGDAGHSSPLWSLARAEMRWAMPFFFLLTGLYLGRQTSDVVRDAGHRLRRTTYLFGIASLLYLPVCLMAKGQDETLKRLSSISLLLSGTYFHLWFFSALILGLLVVRGLFASERQRLLGPLSAVIIVAALLCGSYGVVVPGPALPAQNFVYARHLLSVPFLTLGLWLARNGPLPGPVAICLLLSGALLQLVEVAALGHYANVPAFGHEFLLGTLPMTLGLASLAHGAKGSVWGAAWGRRYALGIYLLHPLCIALIAKTATLLTQTELSPPLLALGAALSALAFTACTLGIRSALTARMANS